MPFRGIKTQVGRRRRKASYHFVSSHPLSLYSICLFQPEPHANSLYSGDAPAIGPHRSICSAAFNHDRTLTLLQCVMATTLAATSTWRGRGQRMLIVAGSSFFFFLCCPSPNTKLSRNGIRCIICVYYMTEERLL